MVGEFWGNIRFGRAILHAHFLDTTLNTLLSQKVSPKRVDHTVGLMPL